MAIKGNIKSIFIGIVLIAILVLAFVIFEFYESRKELLNTLKNESINLSESLSLSFENTLTTNDEIESQIINRLYAVSGLVSHLNLNQNNYKPQINNIKDLYQIDYIYIIDKNGKIQITSDSAIQVPKISSDFMEMLSPLFSDEYNFLDLGIIKNEINNENMYIVGTLGSDNNNCILIGLSAAKILEFRKKIGIGKQIQEIANNPDIVYILLQDSDGILSASKGTKAFNPIDSDTFLIDAYKSTETKTRFYNYNNQNVFESVKAIRLNDGTIVLNRIGLSLENTKSIQQRSMRRVVLIGLVIFVLFAFIYAYFMTRKGFDSLKQEHKLIQSYTDLVLENMADAVIAVDKKGIIAYFNKQAGEIFNTEINGAIGNEYLNLFPTDLLQINQSKDSQKTILNRDIVYINSLNSKRNLDVSISFIFANDGSIDLIIAIIKDLTDRLNLQQLVERKEKLSAMGELAAGVAHEIRNPLNSINVIIQRIQQEFEPKNDAEEYKSLLSTVRAEVVRVNNIIKQFLKYARPSKLQLGKYSINSILSESISIIESEANLKNIRIEKQFEKEIISYVDKDKLIQVVLNLLKNSVEAIESDGIIHCKLQQVNENIEISITDNGIGIPDEIKLKVFNLYFTTKDSGTGLGLSLVHQIISEHNGNILINSDENDGTTFKIILPIENPITSTF